MGKKNDGKSFKAEHGLVEIKEFLSGMTMPDMADADGFKGYPELVKGMAGQLLAGRFQELQADYAKSALQLSGLRQFKFKKGDTAPITTKMAEVVEEAKYYRMLIKQLNELNKLAVEVKAKEEKPVPTLEEALGEKVETPAT